MDDQLGEATGDDGGEYEDEVRYGLTALGASHLEDSRSFAGFGPCFAMRPSEAPASFSATKRRRIGRSRRQRAASLFG